MNDLISIIHKNNTKLESNKSWEYTVDLRNSCIFSDQYSLTSAVFRGDGHVEDDIIRVSVHFFVSNSSKNCIRTKRCRGIKNAILYVFHFPENYHLCVNCCNLVKSPSECNECMFYKVYMEYKGKKEICGICQEPSYRTMLSCKHHFHKSCLLKMDPEDIKCPLCRHPVKEDTIYTLFEEDEDEDSLFYISDDEF